MLPPELAASRLRLLLTWQADKIERSYRIPSYSLRKVDIIYIFLFIIYIFTRNFYLTVINFARLLAASAFHSPQGPEFLITRTLKKKKNAPVDFDAPS